MAKISIVLAVYNGEKDVDKCLNSLRGQTMKDIEIICVDDGSTDNTVRVLKKHVAEDPRVKVFEQGENRKLLLAIKRGVKEATGDYIMFVDDDDWYEPNACENVAEIIDADHPDVVYFGTNLVEPEEKVKKDIRENRLRRVESTDMKFSGENTLWLDDIRYVYLWNKAVKADVAKKAYDAMPDVEMTYYSDIYACMMIHYYAKTVVSTSKKLTNYNYTNGISGQGSMTAERYDYFLRCTRIYEDGIRNFFEKESDNKNLDIFVEGYRDRMMPYIRIWRDKVQECDAVEAFESLVKYYDIEDVMPLLKHNYYRANASCKKYKRRAEKLERQLEATNKKSFLSRLIGR
ncbi:MAG: glycosyltransferase family 2 protein [Clostridiales bacterium]|nr:glycosyltransferase family 2 protein [Candidatus Crickella equi]